MKSGLFIALLFLIASCSNTDTEARPLLDFIPENAFLIVTIDNHQALKNTFENNAFITSLAASKTYKNIYEKVHYLNYLNAETEGILALTEMADQRFEFVYITTDSPGLLALDSVRDITHERIEFANNTLDKYTLDDAVFFSKVKGQKIMISSSELLLEKLGHQNKHQQSEVLRKLYSITNTQRPASIFVNLNASNSLLATISNTKDTLKVSGFSDWISLDLDDRSQHLNLSGISIANDSTWNYLDLFANTAPLINKIATFAPRQSEAIQSYTFDDYAVFAKNRALATGLVAPEEPPMNAVEEIGLIHLNNQLAIVLNTYGADGISEHLAGVKKSGVEFQGLEIMELNDRDFLNDRFSPVIRDYKSSFCVLINNAFVFAEEANVLRTVIRNHKNAATFNTSTVFKAVDEQIAEAATILYISNSKHVEKVIQEHSSADFANDLKKIQWSNYGVAGHIIADKNFYHTNLLVREIEQGSLSDTRNSPVLRVALDTEIATDPQFVTNHRSGRQEIIVQDRNNVLHLISSSGKILWKKQLESLIQGKVKQVDIFKNGRLQFAFTTNNQFLVIDRNGNEVKKFTQTYEGGNLNPLAVFDYEKKKNYRFVVTQGDKTFMYDNKATIVKGFKYVKASQPILAAPKHIVIGNKDFLVFKLSDGSLELRSRVGDVRIAVPDKIDFSENDVYRYKNKFAVTDKKGVLHQIDLNGKVTKTNFNLSNDHGMATTANMLVLLNDNILTIQGKKVELELGVYTQPRIFYINNKVYVSVTDLQNEKVYLFDSQAKAIGNFPKNGASGVDLGDIENNRRLELLVKESDNTLVVYGL